MLYDLVPRTYVHQLLLGSPNEQIESSPGHAVVLQLDICNFTVISQSMTQQQLAELMNALVSDFDENVTGKISQKSARSSIYCTM